MLAKLCNCKRRCIIEEVFSHQCLSSVWISGRKKQQTTKLYCCFKMLQMFSVFAPTVVFLLLYYFSLSIRIFLKIQGLLFLNWRPRECFKCWPSACKNCLWFVRLVRVLPEGEWGGVRLPLLPLPLQTAPPHDQPHRQAIGRIKHFQESILLFYRT